MRIIGLCGRKMSGKNFIADRIEMLVGSRPECEYINCDVEKAAFADPIKEFVVNVLGIRRESAYGSDAQKNSKTSYLWENMPAFVRERNHGKAGAMTAREVMQVFGTELTRLCWGEDIWVNAMKRRAVQSSAGYFVITDVRFQNEAEVIRELGGEVWLIKGPSSTSGGDHHASEAIEEVVVDKVIENDYLNPKVTYVGSPLYDDLSEQIKAAMGLAKE
jgi:hypothetical protein